MHVSPDFGSQEISLAKNQLKKAQDELEDEKAGRKRGRRPQNCQEWLRGAREEHEEKEETLSRLAGSSHWFT